MPDQPDVVEQPERITTPDSDLLRVHFSRIITEVTKFQKHMDRFIKTGEAQIFRRQCSYVSELASSLGTIRDHELWTQSKLTTPRSTVRSREVFATPELLEQIMLWVHPMDVLHIMAAG